jgi:hypothetical protein
VLRPIHSSHVSSILHLHRSVNAMTRGNGDHTSFRVSIAGNELSNSVTSSLPPPPPPSKSSSPSSTNAALSWPVANWLASSPSNAFSRVRKSSPVAPSKPEVPAGSVCAIWRQPWGTPKARSTVEGREGGLTAGVELLERGESVCHLVLWMGC